MRINVVNSENKLPLTPLLSDLKKNNLLVFNENILQNDFNFLVGIKTLKKFYPSYVDYSNYKVNENVFFTLNPNEDLKDYFYSLNLMLNDYFKKLLNFNKIHFLDLVICDFSEIENYISNLNTKKLNLYRTKIYNIYYYDSNTILLDNRLSKYYPLFFKKIKNILENGNFEINLIENENYNILNYFQSIIKTNIDLSPHILYLSDKIYNKLTK